MKNIKIALLKTNGSIEEILVDSDKIHLVLGGTVTFVGSIDQLSIVACANKDIILTSKNPFCDKLEFDETSSDIALVKTTQTGNPTNIDIEKIHNFLCNIDLQ